MGIRISDVQITDNSDLVAREFQSAVERALTECGMTAEGYAKDLCPVDTGALRNSITHQVETEEEACYIGTAMKYGPYVEMGTGKYVKGGSAPWVYQDDKGKWHRTSGQPAKPYIKPAVGDHESQWKEIIHKHLKNS